MLVNPSLASLYSFRQWTNLPVSCGIVTRVRSDSNIYYRCFVGTHPVRGEKRIEKLATVVFEPGVSSPVVASFSLFSYLPEFQRNFCNDHMPACHLIEIG